MKRYVLPLLILTALQIQAQEVQWASKVLQFSSELTPIQYSANQALGKPNVLPAGGQSPNAWTPNKPNRNEFLKLGFANPISIQQIAIAESFAPSALYKVFLYDESGNEYEVNTLNPQGLPIKSRVLNIFMEKTPYKVAAVKLEFDGAAVPDYYGIDAVAISDYNYPIIAFVPTPELLASGLQIEPLDKSVNSEYSEVNPLLSADGKTLFFSRRNHPENIGGVTDKEDIWYSELGEDGKWQLAKNMGKPYNNIYPNFINSISSITPDGKAAIMLLGNKYLSNGRMSHGVSISTYDNGKWSDPTPLEITNDYNLNERANYFLSSSRRVIILSVERSDTHGDRDLYVTMTKGDNFWSEPMNLGRVVNTVAEESSPFLSPDERTLYFSSKGFSGYGGADIYITRRLDDTWTNWSEPENLGPEINSQLDDLFFNIPNFSEYAYYSRGVSENNLDIYRAKLPIFRPPEVWVTVRGKLSDGVTGSPIPATLAFESGGVGSGSVQTDPQTGLYEIKLKAGEVYAIRAEAKDHIAESQSLDLRKITSNQVVEHKDMMLMPVPVTPVVREATITLNNLFLGFDQSSLRPQSFPELNRIVARLKEQPEIQVEISGHTCDIGAENYNLTLSERRAKAVQKYFVDQGIKSDRISVFYFGESKPTVPNTSEQNRSKNRRVEIKMIRP